MKVFILLLVACLVGLSSGQCELDFGDKDPCDQGFVTQDCTVAGGGTTLSILHTNDVRGKVMPLNKYGSECGLADQPLTPNSNLTGSSCHGGVSARKHFVEKVRAEVGADKTLLLDAGNYYFGSLWYAKWKGQSDIPYVEALGYDAMGTGSNEYFSGTTELMNFLSGQPGSIVTVTTNLDTSNDEGLSSCKKDLLAECLKKFDVIVKDGVKIGLLGFVPQDLFTVASPGSDVSLVEYKSAATTAIAALKATHPDCNIIIALSQLVDDDNIKLAQSVEGIDIIVGGNHVDREKGGDGLYDYPYVLSGPGGDPVHLVSAYHFGAKIGRHDVTFDADGVIASYDADKSNTYKLGPFDEDEDTELYIPNAGEYQYDPDDDAFNTWDKVRVEYVDLEQNFKNVIQGETTATIDGSREYVEHIDSGTTVGTLGDGVTQDQLVTNREDWPANCKLDITGQYPDKYCCYTDNDEGASNACFKGEDWWSVFGCRHSDCPMGRFAANAQMMECSDCKVAFVNGGSIRNTLEAGDITKGDLISVFPYQNTLSTFNIQGVDMKMILEHSVSHYLPNDGDGKFMQIAGARFTWNPLAPINNKITAVDICDDWDRSPSPENPSAGKCVGNWQPMDAQRYYKANTNNYIRGGGDDFDFSKATNVNDFGEQMEVVLQKYLDATTPYTTLEVLESTTCTGEINDYDKRWTAGITGDVPNEVDCSGDGCQDCRIYRSSGLTELTCPMNVASEALCATGSDSFFQNLTLTSDQCVGAACTGFGFCNELNQCECKDVEVEDFKNAPADLIIDTGSGSDVCGAGFKMFKGEACEVERELFSFSGGGIVYVLAAANIVVSIVAIAWYNMNGKFAVIRLSQPVFHISSACGALISGVGSVLLLPDNNSTSMCGTSLVVSGAGLMLLYGSIFAKTHRIDALMNNKRLRKVKVSNVNIFSRIIVYVVFEVVAIVILLIIAPVKPTARPFDDKWMYSITCSAGDQTGMWVMVLCIIQFGMLGYGCYLAYRVKDVRGAMNEAFYIGISLYSSFLIGIVAIFVVLNSLKNPDLVYMLGPSTINFCSLVSVLSTLVPKVINLTPEMKGLTAEQAMKLDSAGGTSTGTSSNTSNNTSNQGDDVTPTGFFEDVTEAELKDAVAGATKEQSANMKAKCEMIISLID